jgi:hypothetical protein
MANKFPLIFDTTDGNKIKELPSGDNLNLQGSSIVNVVDISAFGTIQANTIIVENLTASGSNISAVAITGNYNDLLNKPNIFSGDYNDLANRPVLFSGSYNDLSNKPVIPVNLSQLNNDAGYVTNLTAVVPVANVVGLASVAVTNNYNDLSNRPDVITREEFTDGTLTIDVTNTGNLTGSVFADNGTLLVNHIDAIIPAEVLQGTATIDINSIGVSNFNFLSSGGVNANFATIETVKLSTLTAEDSTIIIDANSGKIYGTHVGTLDGNVNRSNSFSITAGAGITISPNGILNIPNATNVTVSATGTTEINSTETLTLQSSSGKVRIVSNQPSTARGELGDKAGMIAFDSVYIYYCKAEYTDGLAPIWVRQAWGDTTDWS